MKCILAIVAGAILPLSLAPFNFWPLGLLSIGVWFWLLSKPEVNAPLIGWLFGIGKFGVGVSWVYVSINVYGNAGVILAAVLVFLFISGLSLLTMVNAFCYRVLRSEFFYINAITFSALFVLFEWIFTWFLTGFPWLYPAYGHIDTWLAGYAPIGGVLLISFGLCLSACFGAVGLSNKNRKSALMISMLPWVLGAGLKELEWVESIETETFALVQGNIDQATKWLPENRDLIASRYHDLSVKHLDADTIIWPEAAITYFRGEATRFLDEMDKMAREAGTSVVLGIPTLETIHGGDGEVFRNTAIAIGSGSGTYVKRRLVPFGEYVPMQYFVRGLIDFFDLPMSHSEPGAHNQPTLRLGKSDAAIAICYEVVYPELVRKQASSADLLITISNDSWFGESIGPFQHLEIARMRALENGRWILRATNSGITAAADHQGSIRYILPQSEVSVLRGSYDLMKGDTPYNKLGESLILVLLALAILPSAWLRFIR